MEIINPDILVLSLGNLLLELDELLEKNPHDELLLGLMEITQKELENIESQITNPNNLIQKPHWK